jgi:LruC domain-containing protein
MNPEVNPANKEHVVLLYDNPTQRYLIGFEDINRESNSDNDFNDVIIYATSNPVKAIDGSNVLPSTPSQDGDGDGVNDAYDEYPNDADRAYNVYYPSKNAMASVAFEDLWPSKGDYDLNDVVVDYQYHAVTNAANRIKDLNAKYKLRAAGGVFKNAFSVEFPFNRTNVIINSGNTTLGLEAAASKAIIRVFANSKALISTYNTLEGKTWVETDTVFAKMTLTTPANATLGAFNPFIYIDESDKGRGYEVHLPGQLPTSFANTSIFGTNTDATNSANGVYYKTKTGLPYAISTPEKFDYPYEKVQIISAHKKFATWVQSGGASFPDWYKNLTGYRDPTKIYVKP